MSAKKADPTEELPFESILGQLEGLVKRLEEGDLPLEGSLEAFEKGMDLAAQANERLEAAQARVDQLIEGKSGSQITSFPSSEGGA